MSAAKQIAATAVRNGSVAVRSLSGGASSPAPAASDAGAKPAVRFAVIGTNVITDKLLEAAT